MNSSEAGWIDLLEDEDEANRFFDSAPDLGQCDLFSVQIDERDKELAIGLDLTRLPDKPLPEWVEKNLNAFKFYLAFGQLEELAIDGWLHTPKDSVAINAAGGGRVQVEIRGDGECIRFTSGSIKMFGSRAYRASSVP
ncbi:Imm50 family immunity protein [Streptomyces rimosus]|uniref:Imm50 family immunity protein n=1 Tax=Streptomyces rimosus TaxID=1927 RepID=UPI0004CBC80C|nr:Imm50 family immunity protein [Streptomyces rimosus]